MHASHALLTPSPHVLLWTFLFSMLFGSTVRAQSFRDASELLVASDLMEERRTIFGVSLIDANNDGFVDLYHPSRLYLNQGDTLYVDALQALGIEEPFYSWGSIWGDADNDGYLDVFFEDLGSESPSDFSANLHGILFRPSDEAFGIQSEAAVQGSLWADFNSDGRLDLFVGSDFGRQFDSELFLNIDDQHFDEVGVQAGITAPVNLYGAAGADYDRDGDIDIYIAACSQDSVESINALFRNDGQAAFTEVAEDAGVNDAYQGWGVVWIDYDNDGWLDLFVANMQPPGAEGYSPPGFNRLYHNDGEGGFVDVAQAAGVAGAAEAFNQGVTAADYDNDGWIDLYITGFFSSHPNRLYRNNGDGTFSDVTESTGLPPIVLDPAVASADVNGDGWVDLVTASSLRGTRLFLNEPGGHHWLKVQLRGKTANRFGVGARVDLYAEGRQQVREITAGNGMVAQNHNLTAHFGLGTSERIDSLVVRWPGGSVDRMADLTVDQHITVVENIGLNNPPDAFRLLAPTDETVLSQNTPFLFEWEAASDEEDDALTYTLYLMSPEDEMVFEGLHEPRAEVDLGDLLPHQTYYWSVDVTDGHTIRRSVDRFQLMLNRPTSTESPAEVPELRLNVYPNPFHDVATLRITLPEPTDINVRVYDLMGRTVRKLATGHMIAGEHTMRWDGRNDSGLAVAAGLYVYRVQTPQHRFTTSVIRLP